MTRRQVAMSPRTIGPIMALVLVLGVVATCRLGAQDTSAIDRGVRVGIIYRPGVRPGFVLLPRQGSAVDSARAIIARDLDYSDRFEVITLPGGDSIRLGAPAVATRPATPPSRGQPTRPGTATSPATGGGGGGARRGPASTIRSSRRWAPTSRSI